MNAASSADLKERKLPPTRVRWVKLLTREALWHRNRVQVLFTSVDPKRDHSEILKEYIPYFDRSLPSYVDLILVARALERIGDHATNIAEDSFWRDQAADIRHTYSPKQES